MRAFIVCCCLLVSGVCLAQPSIEAAHASQPSRDSSPVIRLSCRSTLSPDNNNPLILLNGLPVENKDFKGIDVNDIERIDILKNAEATAIYGSPAVNGVILITTRQWTPGRFVIKDRVSGVVLPGATILLSNNSHTVMAAAGDSGIAVADKLKAGEEYTLNVTMTGYKKLDSVFRYQPVAQTIFLEKDVKECAEVVVVAYPVISCHAITGTCCIIHHCKISKSDSIINSNESKQDLFRAYPNPVQRGQNVTIELKNTEDYSVQVKIISLSGQLLLQQQVTKNKDRLTILTDSRWSPGTYFVRVTGREDQHTAKLIIQ